MEKRELRRIMLDKRRAVESRSVKDGIIAEKFFKLFDFDRYKSVLLYVPLSGEVDDSVIAKTLFERGVEIGLPYTLGNTITPVRVESMPTLFAADRMGNLVGLKPQEDMLVEQIDCVVIPLIAFNDKLIRLGYGLGCYDRFLRSFSGTVIGLAYDEQYTSKFVGEEHDMPCDYIVTPSKVYHRGDLK